ncbi:MAG TPA: hypothetical protein VHK69_19375, partial [Chitinophagaceae bacterium]|nr:hypothetical protein [Chitinophagaceae bacterium]
GAFTLRDRDYTGGATVMVEEYKRPRFYAEWKPVEGSYGLGDSITVTGNAQAYAGNALPGVPVRYRVTRLARFPYPWYGRGTGPAQQPQEIAHGETVTDASGRFTVTFAALPDRSIDPKTLPVFDYRVQADVTDINGETRSAEQTLSAGYRSVLLQATLPERLVADSLATLPVRTQNMQGTYLPSRVTVQVHRLQPEQRLLRPRYWQQPDQFVMDKAEYVRLFPNDIYANEHEYRHWPLAEQVVQHSDSTRPDGRLPLPARTWAPGFYRLRFTTTDAEGRPVESDHFVEVYDPKNRTLARPEYLWAAGTGAPAEPGTTATVQIGSSASEVFVVQDISRLEDPEAAGKGKTKELTYLAVNGEKKSLSFPVREQDRGGFDVTYFFVKDNRLFQVTDIVRVPWTNKQLQVRWGTFRDKLLPGAKETWTVTISGAKGEQAAAELLAGMYDASLDQFTGHQWERPGIWPELNYAEPWNGLYNFAAVASDLHGGMSWTTRTVIREYDYLLGFRGQPIHRWRNKKELEKARMNGSLSLNHLSGDGAQYDDQDFS